VIRRVTPTLEAIFLDVGQGDSALLRFPGGGAMLVDAGGVLPVGPRAGARTSHDPGTTRVVPFLRAAGIRRLEVVVATHPHPDHVGGLAAVLATFPVDELWVCWDDPEPALAPLLEVALRRGVKVSRPRLVRRPDGVVVEPLWPHGEGEPRGGEGVGEGANGRSSAQAGRCTDPGDSANDSSVVLRVAYGAASVLLAGDIEEDAERRLAARGGERLRSQVLKVPHHGSATSSSEVLLRTVAPRLAVISCGVQNSFGFPAPAVLARYREHGIEVARVDQLGAISVRLDRNGGLRREALAAGVIP